MLGTRIRQFRLSRGFSQDQLVDLIGGLVTKASISKYEKELAKPSNLVLNKIAKALNVKAAFLYSEPSLKIDFIGYRKGSGLLKKEESKVEAHVCELLEEYIKLKALTSFNKNPDIPVMKFNVTNYDDVEEVAENIRGIWKLGLDPISNITTVLEDKGVFVISLDAPEKFDGISAYASDKKNNILAAAVVSQRDIPGERQRLNLVHELGHLVLNVNPDLDEEKAAFRFGAAFLAPKDMLYHEVGTKRQSIRLEELFLLKKKLGLSMQALVYRLHDLGIVSDNFKKRFFISMSKRNWRKHEPNELKPEEPHWLKYNIYKAYAEGLVTLRKAEEMLGEKIDKDGGIVPNKCRSFVNLSAKERNRRLSAQAKIAAPDYEIDSDWLDMGIKHESR